MSPDVVIDVFRHALSTVVFMIVIIVGPGLCVGLMVAMFQAATQINEMSMSFVPKFLITIMTLMVAGPWLVNMIVTYAKNLYSNIPNLIG